jgi:hypothetical protein
VAPNEVIFLLRGWPVLAPIVSFVVNEPSIHDQCLGVFERFPIKFYGHCCSSRGQRLPFVRLTSGIHTGEVARRLDSGQISDHRQVELTTVKTPNLTPPEL